MLNLFRTGTIPSDLDFHRKDRLRLHQYLDIPLLGDIITGVWEKKGDKYLHFYKLRGFNNYTGLSSDKAADGGHLETLKWVRANGGKWTSNAADNAARGGRLETLKWIRSNGGEWTFFRGRLGCSRWTFGDFEMGESTRRRVDSQCGRLGCRRWSLGNFEICESTRRRMDI
jgi:hypothetical protein